MEQIQPRRPMRDPFTHRLTIGILVMFNGFLMLLALALALTNNNTLEDEQSGALIFAMTAIAGTLLLFDPVREVVGRLFPQRKHFAMAINTIKPSIERLMGFTTPILRDGEMVVDRRVAPVMVGQSTPQAIPYPDKPELLGFDAHNTIHMVALVLSVFVLGLTFATFALAGGLSGDIAAESVNVESILLQFFLMVGVAILGVGLFFRRNVPETLKRLGLDQFSWTSVGIGQTAGFGLLILLIMMVGLWVVIVGQETVEQQSEASEAISESITTIWMVLLISITSSVGEEIAFRGALQPIFGLWPTAIFFVLIHTQYLLTPATLIIFVPAIAFGYLRRHYNLYAAIAAHFTYNFVQLVLALL